MAISYIKTEEVENITKELLSLISEVSEEFNYLYSKFSRVPRVTKEWVGNQSDYYFKRVESDKKQYTVFVNQLKNIPIKINRDVYEFKMCTNNNLKEES